MNSNSHPSAFQATLAMIQTEPQIADSAAELHDNVYLCQLIAGARFGEDAAQDPEIVFTLLPLLSALIGQYADAESSDDVVEEGASYAHPDGEEIASVWDSPDVISEPDASQEQEERIAGGPTDAVLPSPAVLNALLPAG